MNQLNQLIIDGNLVRDAERKEVGGGKVLCTFSIGNNRSIRRADGSTESSVSYFDCECWSRLAENVAKNGRKGTRVRIVGRLQQNVWSDRDGNRHSDIKIVCDEVGYLPRTQKDDEMNTYAENEKPNSYAPQSCGSTGTEQTEPKENDNGLEIPF